MAKRKRRGFDQDQRRLFRRLGQYALRHKKVIVLGLVTMAIHALCRQFPIYAVGTLIDKVITLDVNQLRETQVKQYRDLVAQLSLYAGGGEVNLARVERLREKRRGWHESGDFKKAVTVMTDTERDIEALHLLLDDVAAEPRPSRDEVRARLDSLARAQVSGAQMTPERLIWLRWISLAMIASAILGAVMYFLNEYFFKWLATKVVVELRTELMRHLMSLPLTFFHRRRMGDIHSRLTNDVQATFQTVNLFVSELMMEPITIAATLATAFAASWRLSLFIFLLVPLIAYPVVRLGDRIKRNARKGFESLGETTEVMMQSMSGIRIVKSFRAEEAEIARFVRHNDAYMQRTLALVKTKAMGRSVMDLLYSVSLAGFLFFGGWLLVRDQWELTAGDLVMFVTAVGMIYRPMRRLAHAYGNFQESLAASGRLFELLDTPVEEETIAADRRIKRIEKGVALENVSFSYVAENGPVLENVSFQIGRGETVALVGKSGAGKSTIADLIARFYKPTAGRILVDGEPLESLDKAAYLERVALVSQQPFVFNTTVRENILYGRPGASNEEVVLAARAANIHEVIEKLPQGYDTIVGDRGATLSGGQLQRLTIARAILRNADILILDEATSALDNESERLVQEAIDRLTQGKTALVIAHRLSTIRKATRIIVLDHGKIREQGTHDELLALGGSYARLHAAHED